MATCQLCSPDDNHVPDEAMFDHIRLFHPDHYTPGPVSVIDVTLDVPPELTEHAEAVMTLLGRAVEPFLTRLDVLEDKGRYAYTAGFKDGHRAASTRSAAILRGLAGDYERDNPTDYGHTITTFREVAQNLEDFHDEDRASDLPHVITPQEILKVLHGGEPVELDELRFAVAETPASTTFNVQTQLFEDTPSWYPFIRGEILVINPDGREPFGERRHIGKWGVGFTVSETYEAALRERQRVLGRPE